MSLVRAEPVDTSQGKDATAGLSFGAFEESVGFLLRIAQLTAFELMFEKLGNSDLKIGEFTLLLAISENPGVRQGVMADVLKIKWSNMTKLVRSLEDRNLVERHVPPHDRRSVELRLTADGRKLLDAMAPAVFEADRRSLPMLTDMERKQLLNLLRKVAGWPALKDRRP